MRIISKQTDLIELGDAGGEVVGTIVVQLTGTGWSGSVVVKGRVRGASEHGVSYAPIPYVRRSLAGAASDDATVSAALTGDAIIEVNAAGLQVALDHAHVGGTLAVDFQPIAG